MASVHWDVLVAQDDKTSNAVIANLAANENFQKLSRSEGEAIIQRDEEDDLKLAKGIEFSISRGVLPAKIEVEKVEEIEVEGRTADDVAHEILKKMGGGEEGKVVVLQGLSGTGKGTTVANLQRKLPKCICWSNGNVFRCVTFLVSLECEKQGWEFSADILTPERVAAYMNLLSFEPVEGGQFDIIIDVFGEKKLRVSEICNTTLKAPPIGSRVPTVAESCQGEVVLFAAKAVKTLQEAGFNVLLEGRAQTLNYIRSPYRYTLVIRDSQLLGQRRAAQRVMAWAVGKLQGGGEPPSPETISETLAQACAELA